MLFFDIEAKCSIDLDAAQSQSSMLSMSFSSIELLLHLDGQKWEQVLTESHRGKKTLPHARSFCWGRNSGRDS